MSELFITNYVFAGLNLVAGINFTFYFTNSAVVVLLIRPLHLFQRHSMI